VQHRLCAVRHPCPRLGLVGAWRRIERAAIGLPARPSAFNRGPAGLPFGTSGFVCAYKVAGDPGAGSNAHETNGPSDRHARHRPGQARSKQSPSWPGGGPGQPGHRRHEGWGTLTSKGDLTGVQLFKDNDASRPEQICASFLFCWSRLATHRGARAAHFGRSAAGSLARARQKATFLQIFFRAIQPL
jgi:hypothetical protein